MCQSTCIFQSSKVFTGHLYRICGNIFNNVPFVVRDGLCYSGVLAGETPGASFYGLYKYCFISPKEIIFSKPSKELDSVALVVLKNLCIHFF